jgi:hypothetical protein
LQEIPPSDQVDQGGEDDWEAVGEPAERSRSLAPAVTEVVPQAPVAEGRTEPAAATTAEERAATEAAEDAPAELDSSTLAAYLAPPTVTVVWSSL